MNKTTQLVKSLFCRVWALISALALIFVTHNASAQSVGVQFVNSSIGGPDYGEADSLLPTDTAGAPPYAQANWNDLSQSGGANSTDVTLTNSLGAPTTLTIQWKAPGVGSFGIVGQTGPNGAGDGKLMDGYLSTTYGDGTATDLNPAHYAIYTNVISIPQTPNSPTVYVGGLRAWYQNLGAEAYSIVIYQNQNNWDENVMWLQSVAGSPFNGTMLAGANLTPVLWSYSNGGNPTGYFGGAYRQIPNTATNQANNSSDDNYGVFTALTNDAVLIHTGDPNESWASGAMNGFQIVPILPVSPIVATPSVSPSLDNYALVPVTLSDTASGDPFHTNLWFQWYSDNATGGAVTHPILNATNTAVTVIPTNNATTYYVQYVCVVSNIFGATTSSIVTLQVDPAVAPILTQDTTPGAGNAVTNVYAYAGSSISFSAAFSGTPGTYLWQSNSVNISGATNTTLTLNNLPLSASAWYDLTATNIAGGTNSTPVSLVVLPALPAPNSSVAYPYEVFTNGPVAYWRFGETLDNTNNSVEAYDYSGNGNNATYGTNAILDQPGPQAPLLPGFESTNIGVSLQYNIANSYVAAPSLNLNTNAVTITAWINPSSGIPNAGLFMWRGPNGDVGGFGFGGATSNSMAELGYNWDGGSGSTWSFNSQLYPPLNQWSFVALTITPTNTTFYLDYIDANSGATNLLKSVQSIVNTNEAFSGGTTWIGSDPFSGNGGRTFNGSIDEMAVFKKSLSEGQIQNFFLTGQGIAGTPPVITQDVSSTNVVAFAGQPLSITAVGGGAPLPSYQWQSGSGGVFTNVLNGGGISGATNSTLTFANNTLANNMKYQLVLANASGSATSSVVSVSLVPSDTQINTVLAESPMALWLLNETNDPSSGTVTAYDYVGGFNGTYGSGAENAFDDVTGPLPSEGFDGFPTNNGALETFQGGTSSYVAIPTLNLNGNSITITAWINPSSGPQANAAGIFFCRDNSTTSGLCYANTTQLGFNWAGNYWSWNSGLTPPVGVWSFVALVITPTSATIYLANTNGLASNSDTGISNPAQDIDAPYIGFDSYTGANRTFGGEIGQVAVFNSSLTQTQIQQLYNAAAPQPPQSLSGLKFTASPVISGTSLKISATNSGAGTVYLLTSTNVAAPLNTWTPVWTNVLSGDGSFTTNLPNAVNPASKQQFYLLSNTNN